MVSGNWPKNLSSHPARLSLMDGDVFEGSRRSTSGALPSIAITSPSFSSAATLAITLPNATSSALGPIIRKTSWKKSCGGMARVNFRKSLKTRSFARPIEPSSCRSLIRLALTRRRSPAIRQGHGARYQRAGRRHLPGRPSSRAAKKIRLPEAPSADDTDQPPTRHQTQHRRLTTSVPKAIPLQWAGRVCAGCDHSKIYWTTGVRK